MPRVRLLKNVAFGRCDYVMKTLMNEINVLTKEAQEGALVPSTTLGHRATSAACSSGLHWNPTIMAH